MVQYEALQLLSSYLLGMYNEITRMVLKLSGDFKISL